MSSISIYEDQENRVPTSLHERGLRNKHGESNEYSGRENSHLQIPPQKSNILQNKRTVLSSINVNSTNIRVQPRRAAKQGVSYESGVPHTSHGSGCGEVKKSSSVGTVGNSLQSFTIHQDDSSNSSWPYSLRSSSSDSSVSSETLQKVGGESRGVGGESRGAKLREINADLTQSPVKDRSKGKANEHKRKMPLEPRVESPEAMEVSMVDGGVSMSVDTPLPTPAVTSLPREDILERRDKDLWDVSEYAQDIYNCLRDAEICHKPRANYMLKQTDITASMRWILVDWLVEVSEEYSLHTETLYLAVSYIDRFLSHMSVKRDKLQLVGTTAMFIASKYEEIYPPDVSQFAYITDNTYRVTQILRMEHLILKVLSFDMAVPTALLFLNYFARICNCSDETLHLAMFISELSMLDSDPFLRFLPSKIAASALALANFTQGLPAWPEVLETKSRYSLDDLRECYVNLNRVFSRVGESAQHAIRDKYKVAKWHSVSNIPSPDNLPWSFKTGP